jgi:Fe-S oxidoreductase
MKESYIYAFDPEGKSKKFCKNCGLCLQKCPVMKMGKEEARAEQERLLGGGKPLRVLNECTLCYNCNNYCPHGLNPFALIMERMVERVGQSETGIPPYIQYLFTGHGDSCLFFDIYDSLSEDEKSVLDKWETLPTKSKEVLFISCVGREIPLLIEKSKALKSLHKYAPRGACCGEASFRMGDFQTFSETVDRTLEFFNGLETEQLVCYCGSCCHSFKNVWHDYLNIKLPFEIVSIWEWLWDKVQKGELKVKRPIEKTVAITDSCYSNQLGDKFYGAIRGLHEAAGMSIVELQNNKYDNLCCGMTTSIQNNFDLMESFIASEKAAEKKIQQILETKNNDFTCYCPGCFFQLRRGAKKANIQIHYSLEEILWAFGDEYPVSLMDRASQHAKLLKNKIQSTASD